MYACTADNDGAAFPVANLRSIEWDGDTSVHVNFQGAAGTAGGVDGTIEMTVTDGKEDDVVKAIARAASEATETVIVLADDTTSQYLHAGITAVGTVTPA